MQATDAPPDEHAVSERSDTFFTVIRIILALCGAIILAIAAVRPGVSRVDVGFATVLLIGAFGIPRRSAR